MSKDVELVRCTRCRVNWVKVTSHPLCPTCYQVVKIGGGNVDHDKWKRRNDERKPV